MYSHTAAGAKNDGGQSKTVGLSCPVHTELKKAFDCVTFCYRRLAAEQSRQKSSINFFSLNHYWKQSHVSSNCLSHKPHPCCTDAASQCWSNKTRPVFTLLAVRWPFLVKRVLTWCFPLAPLPPELLCPVITLITRSLFVGKCCDWAEVRLIHYQWWVHPSVNRQMLFIFRPTLILLSDVFKSLCCKGLGGKSEG